MVKAKRGLGKGLGALIPDEEQNVSRETESITLVNINMIKPNKSQPRRFFDESKLDELAKSISNHGILQPIILQSLEKGYEIIAGERRWRASRKAGLVEIPAIIKKMEQVDIAQIALIENLQREDLNAIEEAFAYKSLMNDYSFTQERVSEMVGKSRSHIANIVRLLKLCDEVQQYIIDEKLSGGHGRCLATIDNSETQIKIANRVIENGLSVREIEKIISNLDREIETKTKKGTHVNPSTVYTENALREKLDTRVSVKMGRRKGKIEIEFYGEQDLARILEIIKFD